MPSRNTETYTTVLLPILTSDAFFRLCLSWTYGDHAAAEDIVQETSLRALVYLDSFTEGTNAAAWLRTIARNRVISEIESARRRSRYQRRWEYEPMFDLTDITPEDALLAADEHDVRKAKAAELLTAAGPLYADAVRRRMDGQADDEAAEELGVVPATIRVRRHRGLAQMRSAAA